MVLKEFASTRFGASAATISTAKKLHYRIKRKKEKLHSKQMFLSSNSFRVFFRFLTEEQWMESYPLMNASIYG